MRDLLEEMAADQPLPEWSLESRDEDRANSSSRLTSDRVGAIPRGVLSFLSKRFGEGRLPRDIALYHAESLAEELARSYGRLAERATETRVRLVCCRPSGREQRRLQHLREVVAKVRLERRRCMVHHGMVDRFTAEELAGIEAILLDRRRQLLCDFQRLEEADAQNAPDGPATPSHLAELGSELQASDISLGRRESESVEIREIDDALARIHAESFGLCEACGAPISKTRLEAIPYAALCLACKTLEET